MRVLEPSRAEPGVRCARCRQSYPAMLEYFGKSATKRNGLSSYCKSCISAATILSRRKKRAEEPGPETFAELYY
jgi:hypothetical protein